MRSGMINPWQIHPDCAQSWSCHWHAQKCVPKGLIPQGLKQEAPSCNFMACPLACFENCGTFVFPQRRPLPSSFSLLRMIEISLPVTSNSNLLTLRFILNLSRSFKEALSQPSFNSWPIVLLEPHLWSQRPKRSSLVPDQIGISQKDAAFCLNVFSLFAYCGRLWEAKWEGWRNWVICLGDQQ